VLPVVAPAGAVDVLVEPAAAGLGTRLGGSDGRPIDW